MWLSLRDHEKKLGGATLGVLRSPPQYPFKFWLLYDNNIRFACNNNMDYAFRIEDVKQLRISGVGVDVEA